jgi:hypothetical protein
MDQANAAEPVDLGSCLANTVAVLQSKAREKSVATHTLNAHPESFDNSAGTCETPRTTADGRGLGLDARAAGLASMRISRTDQAGFRIPLSVRISIPFERIAVIAVSLLEPPLRTSSIFYSQLIPCERVAERFDSVRGEIQS